MIGKHRICLMIFVLILTVNGCKRSSLPRSIGPRDSIILIAPEVFRLDSFIDVLEQVKHYPTEERIYDVRDVGLSEFDRYKMWRNVVIAGVVGQNHVKGLIGETAKKELKRGAQLFLEENLWGELQTVVVIVGNDVEETQQLLDKSAETVFQLFREEERQKIMKLLYMRGYQNSETEKMETLLGASFKVPLGYKLAKNEDNFMTYVRKNPDRLVTLFYRYEPIENPIRFRDSLFSIHFRGDKVVSDNISLDSSNKATEFLNLTSLDTLYFKNSRTIKVEGIWRNDKVKGGPMGGPFMSYIFKKEGIWYFLDGHVFAPGKKKWPLLDELEGILNTFYKEI